MGHFYFEADGTRKRVSQHELSPCSVQGYAPAKTNGPSHQAHADGTAEGRIQTTRHPGAQQRKRLNYVMDKPEKHRGRRPTQVP